MRITYDPSCDSAYIYLRDTEEIAMVKKTVVVDSRKIGGMVHIDLDADGKLLGIEFVGCATKKLPKELLDRAR